MSAHTPGPWQVLFGPNRRGYSQSRRVATRDGSFLIANSIASGGGEPVDEVIEANADLIAAAPDLLASLEHALGCMSEGRCEKCIAASNVAFRARGGR